MSRSHLGANPLHVFMHLTAEIGVRKCAARADRSDTTFRTLRMVLIRSVRIGLLTIFKRILRCLAIYRPAVAMTIK
jgi:hypothetical protein